MKPTKWVLTSSIKKTKKHMKPTINTINTEPERVSQKKNDEFLLEKDRSDEEKIVIGTNILTPGKKLDFIKYRRKLLEEFAKRQIKKKVTPLVKIRFVSPIDKQTFSSKIKTSYNKVLDEFRTQRTVDEIEFEKRMDYDERTYEKNMRESKNTLQQLHEFESNPDLSRSLAFYHYEFYKNRGFKTNNFNLSVDRDEFSLAEFSVAREMRMKTSSNSQRKKPLFLKDLKHDKENDDLENYQRKISEKIEGAFEKKKSMVSPTISSPLRSPKSPKKTKRTFIKKNTNKMFFFWMDLNKGQRIVLKMKNFLSKLIKLKISLKDVIISNSCESYTKKGCGKQNFQREAFSEAIFKRIHQGS